MHRSVIAALASASALTRVVRVLAAANLGPTENFYIGCDSTGSRMDEIEQAVQVGGRSAAL
ncbi:MAG: hypothetical protein KAW67_03055 [Candidatus Eisenbacteria sp.]|nr:hypothetical protein [Candidatus Eisenbacteria bacterium]